MRRCILHHVDQELERCGVKGYVWAHYKPRPTKVELVDLHSVIDQAFTGDDPRKPAGKGEYFQQFTKGKTGGDRLVAQTSRQPIPERRIGPVPSLERTTTLSGHGNGLGKSIPLARISPKI